MRLTVVIHNIRGGGSVSAATAWANEWAARGDSVTLLCVAPSLGEGNPFFVHPAVSLHMADLEDVPTTSSLRAGCNLAKTLLRLRRLVSGSRPDVVIAFDSPVNTRTLLACYGAVYPVVVMEQVHPAYHPLGSFWERWRTRLYPTAACLVNLTEEAEQWCIKKYEPKRSATIFNPVHIITDGRPAPMRGCDRKCFLAAGRFTTQKGFDLLIKAFAFIAEKHPEWTLTLFGEGEERANLEALVNQLGLQERISMPGWETNLRSVMGEFAFFVLPSRYEGFGNVIGEAMVAGLPVIAFDCPSGPSVLIRHEVDGLLVPAENIPALAAAISRLMSDVSLMASLGARAPEVAQRFTMAESLRLWDEVFVAITR